MGGACALREKKKKIARQKINEPRRLNWPNALWGLGVRSTDCATRNSLVLSINLLLSRLIVVVETFIRVH